MSESARAEVVRRFAAAFATCDVDAIVDSVDDGVVWELNGRKVGESSTAFAEQMRTDLSAGSAEVTIEQLIEDGDTVVALNRGRFVPHDGGEAAQFVSAEVYTFAGDTITRIRTYQSLG
ncbi:nuclear transport factor 2 family protein [Pseudonocardia nematodicida]|uniref:Nuclear transport factor 2 family protein n=1 Tax=Pseudonocardia nematodicida TaxID=1206997 RepID=A0ABV1KBC7_9PSEU